MNRYSATIQWHQNNQNFIDNKYSRKHSWYFDGGLKIAASASPLEVPPPYSDPSAVDPEEAFIASLSSCHMLWFLSIAAKEGYLIKGYRDKATGFMEKNDQNQKSITRVILHPNVTFEKTKKPNQQKFDKLHEETHNMCFIAHSVKTKITIEATFEIL